MKKTTRIMIAILETSNNKITELQLKKETGLTKDQIYSNIQFLKRFGFIETDIKSTKRSHINP